jgi:hypothetical protein
MMAGLTRAQESKMNITTPQACASALCLGLALAAAPAGAITLGTVNTFETDSTEGWHVMGSHPNPPLVVDTGGPAGSGDGYLELTAIGGNGAGSRLAVISGTAWHGNYLAAGVGFVELDAINRGATPLQLRLYLDANPGLVGDEALSTVALSLPANNTWTHLRFPVTPGALTGANPTATLQGVTEFRLFHGVDAVFPPLGVVALLGVDNITAVPEPGTLWLWAMAAGALVLPALRRHGASRGVHGGVL